MSRTTADDVRSRQREQVPAHTDMVMWLALTKRQREIVRLIARGDTNIEIGEALHISPRTVQAHVSSIMETLDAKNRTHCVYVLGWVTV